MILLCRYAIADLQTLGNINLLLMATPVWNAFCLERTTAKKKSPAVDLTRIEELRALQPDNPEGLMHELLEILLKSASESLQQARQAIRESAPKKLAPAAHLLKGSCAQFGAQSKRLA
jgi:hypothetical protein